RLDNPEEVFKLGDEVEVVILDVDIEKQRLGLGIKQLSGDPWAKLLKENPKGSLIKGKVTRTTDFGAFIEIAEGIEGLCHVSELSVERVSKVTDAVKEGAEVEVKILDIDRRSRKISLSIKAAKDDSGDFKAYKKEENVKNKEFSNTLGAALQGSIKDTEN
ncbi:S1 RNA-binding domain-containing protein, partial [Myxococcota bacterium]|nr:S1 RNA-binding domain-containing protein [Myxococcota bacterium]